MDQEQVLTQISETATSLNDGIKSFAEIGGKFEAQLAEFNETAKKVLEPRPEDIKSAAELEAENKANLEQAGVMAGITKLEIWDIPVGQALIGGFTAVFASEVIDGFLAAQSDMIKGIVKLAGAGVAIKWGGRLLGSTGSKALGILLAYDGLRMIIPIDRWAKRGATALSGVLPAGGLGGYKPGAGLIPAGGNGKKPDYYEALKGGAR